MATPLADKFRDEQAQRYQLLRREQIMADIERDEAAVATAARKIADWEATLATLKAADKVIANCLTKFRRGVQA